MMRPATMVRPLATIILALGCIQCCSAGRGRERLARRGVLDANSVSEFRRRRRTPEEPPLPGTGGWVVMNGGKGKGKGGGISNEQDDSEEVGSFPYPTVAPMPDTSAGGATAGPAPTNTKQPTTTAPSTPPPTTRAPTVPPPTNLPTASPTLSPETAAQQAACEAAANGNVYMTETSVTVRFLYELLSPDDRNITEVASNVDERVQDFLVRELVDCENGRLASASVGGVGPGEVDTVVENDCSQLVPAESQTCHLMAGTVVLYLLSSGDTTTQDEHFDRVSEKLESAFNGERRNLLSSFVNEELGILGLHYIGANVDEEGDGSNKTEEGAAVGATTGSGESVSSVPAVVVPIVVVACIASALVAVLVWRRRQEEPYDPAKGVLLDGSDDETTFHQEERWKEVSKSRDPLQFRVVETTDDSESGSSGGAAAAAHEVVMADLTGMTVSESFTETSFIAPVFVDPDAVTLYTNSPRPSRYRERHYVVDDTVDI